MTRHDFPKKFLNLQVATVRELCIGCIANIIFAVTTIVGTMHLVAQVNREALNWYDSLSSATFFIANFGFSYKLGSALTKV